MSFYLYRNRLQSYLKAFLKNEIMKGSKLNEKESKLLAEHLYEDDFENRFHNYMNNVGYSWPFYIMGILTGLLVAGLIFISNLF